MAGNPIATFAPPTVIVDAATQTIDCANASHFTWTLGATRTVSTFLNPTPGQVMTLRVVQDATGTRLLTWPSNVAWPTNNTAPTLTVTAARADVFQFIFDGTAAVWRGMTFGLNYAS